MPPRPEAAGRCQGLVLVVEDEFLIALDLGLTLQRHGWRVLGPAGSVTEALALLERSEPPDLALLDVELGGELVLPVARWLAAHDIPFVLTSAHAHPDEIDQSLAGMTNLGKPTDEARLLDAVARAAQDRRG